MIEFALVMIIAVPLFFGVVATGVTLGRGIGAIQVTRDVAHMYAMGVDLSATGTSLMVDKIAADFNLTSSGDSVLILSTIYSLDAAACTAAIISPCNNASSKVFTNRWTFGNTSLLTSSLGTPPAGYIGAKGAIAAANYMVQSTLVASPSVASSITLNAQDSAWVVEGYFKQPNLNFLQPGYTQANQGSYVRIIF